MRPASKVSLGETPGEVENRKCGRLDGNGTDFIPRNRLFDTATHELHAPPEKPVYHLRAERGARAAAAEFAEVNLQEVPIVLKISNPQVQEHRKPVGKGLHG